MRKRLESWGEISPTQTSRITPLNRLGLQLPLLHRIVEERAGERRLFPHTMVHGEGSIARPVHQRSILTTLVGMEKTYSFFVFLPPYLCLKFMPVILPLPLGRLDQPSFARNRSRKLAEKWRQKNHHFVKLMLMLGAPMIFCPAVALPTENSADNISLTQSSFFDNFPFDNF